MNKEVIYLEPEDDITDILTKLQQAEQKLVALVPPKKATMLRSAVNMKLVARVAKEVEKIVVIVTADPAVVKMAMAARIPVAKTLQSRPVIPTEKNVQEASAEIQVIDEETGAVSTEKAAKIAKNPKNSAKIAPEHDLDDADEPDDASDIAASGSESRSEGPSGDPAHLYEFDEDSLEKASEKAKRPNHKAKKPASDANFFLKYRRWFFIGIPVVLVIAVFLVWAFVFAPSATITVAISSTASNFSENVQFTTDPEAADPAAGLFHVSLFSVSKKYTADLTATSEENRGAHATGSLTISYSFIPRNTDDFSVDIPVGAIFRSGDGYDYAATTSDSIVWAGDTGVVGCSSNFNATCTIYAEVTVEAVEAGEDSNQRAYSAWNDYKGLSVANSAAITGGSTEMVKVVSQEDIDKLITAQVEKYTSDGRAMVLEDVSDDVVPIEASFSVAPSEITSDPEVGTAVTSDAEIKVNFTLNYALYTIEKSAIEELIDAKTNLADDQKLYSIGKPYFERFTTLEDGARLKTVLETGPIVTADDIFAKAAGRKTGEVSSILRSINGVSSVEIRTSFFWVWSIPDDRDKVTINIEMEGEA